MAQVQPIRVVGAGISGLFCAYYLSKLGLAVDLFEREVKPGGLIGSRLFSEGLVESAANGLLNSAALESLAADIQINLLSPRPESRRRYIFRRLPRRWPLSFWESLGALWHYLWARPRGPRAQESVQAWGERVLGPAATNFLLAPALRGIYAGDARTLSASLIFGRFFQRARLPRCKPQRRGLVAPEAGMGALIASLQTYLKNHGQVRFFYGQAFGPEHMNVDATVRTLLCTPPHAAGDILRPREPAAAQALAQIHGLPLCTATLFWEQTTPLLKGFGCLFPEEENFHALGVLFNSEIFTHRAALGLQSETWILPDAQLSESDLLHRISDDRRRLGATPTTLKKIVTKTWPFALPRYDLDLERILTQIDRVGLRRRGIYLMGNYLGTLGLSRLILEAKDMANQIAADSAPQ